MKQCSKCKTIKPLEDFYNRKSHSSGKRPACKKCELLDKQLYRKTNPEKIIKHIDLPYEKRLYKIESAKKWNKSHKPERTLAMAKRRALKKQNGVFSVTAKEIKKIQNMNCLYCGLLGGQVDHVIPLTRGGTHSIGNLVPACRSCNASKNDKTITEWQKKNP